MAPDKHIRLIQKAVGRVNEVLMREFSDLSPVDHTFVCEHVSHLLHQSFHQQAVFDRAKEDAKKPAIIIPDGPTNVG